MKVLTIDRIKLEECDINEIIEETLRNFVKIIPGGIKVEKNMKKV